VNTGYQMKVQIDHDLCEGHGKCALAAPSVFNFLEEEDQSYVKLDEVPEEMREPVERAIRLCPRQAIGWIGQER
jgi:ferredoxin